jgi:hypothetical protein
MSGAYIRVLTFMRESARAPKLSFEDASRLKNDLRQKHLALHPEEAQAIASSVGDGSSLCFLEIRSL